MGSLTIFDYIDKITNSSADRVHISSIWLSKRLSVWLTTGPTRVWLQDLCNSMSFSRPDTFNEASQLRNTTVFPGSQQKKQFKL